jgi:O-succinylbenzoic acid--CoA ligase
MTQEQTIPNWLMQRAFLTPDRVAISLEDREITFRELHERAVETAGRLHSLGVKRNTTVAVLSQNSVEMVELLHAIKYIGAVTVLLNTRLTISELDWQMQDANVEFMFVGNKLADELSNNSVAKVHSFGSLFKTVPFTNSLEIQQEFDLTKHDTIMYTSGTTGFPKGVIHTYGNHYWSAVGSALNLGIHQDDCWLACVPFFHVSGLSILMKSVIYGMSIIIQDFDPKQINRAIQEEKVTIISVVTTMLQQMVKELEKTGEYYPESLRCILLGGGPAPKVLLETSKSLSIPVYQTYGMTETASQIITLSPEYSLSKLGSAGKPLFHSQVKIILDEKEQPAMKPGEIVVKGPTVTMGYYNRSDATVSSIQNGWLSTGDIGYLDREGFLYVLDRRKDLIISGGENIYPAEIEGVLLSHPSIDEAGVVGKSHDKWGQVPVAFVVGQKTATEEVQEYCMGKLARYKVPVEVYFVSELPRNATNKLQRHKLISLLEVGDNNERF